MDYLTREAAVLSSGLSKIEVIEWGLINFNGNLFPYRRNWKEKITARRRGNPGPFEDAEPYIRRLARSGRQMEQDGHLYLVKSGVALDFIILGETRHEDDQDVIIKSYSRLDLEYIGWMTERIVPHGNQTEDRKKPDVINFNYEKKSSWDMERRLRNSAYKLKLKPIN
ncbi:MAG TPA: hypothetical protein VJI98_03815 [Candidatus Nanoarchaeia archaeon]|nr:hypothetical protein [Candidatus Nanoarchaeia archaeon]